MYLSSSCSSMELCNSWSFSFGNQFENVEKKLVPLSHILFTLFITKFITYSSRNLEWNFFAHMKPDFVKSIEADQIYMPQISTYFIFIHSNLQSRLKIESHQRKATAEFDNSTPFAFVSPLTIQTDAIQFNSILVMRHVMAIVLQMAHQMLNVKFETASKHTVPIQTLHRCRCHCWYFNFFFSNYNLINWSHIYICVCFLLLSFQVRPLFTYYWEFWPPKRAQLDRVSFQSDYIDINTWSVSKSMKISCVRCILCSIKCIFIVEFIVYQ